MSSRIVACVLAAAGAVVGMSGVAAAQGAAGGVSRPRVIVKELRGPEFQAEREAKREVRVYVEGQEAGERGAQVKRRAEVQARGKAAQERAVVVQKRLQDDDVCEHCGRGGPRDGRSDGGGESKRTIERVIRLGEGGGAQGQAIVIGPDGERREFNFGGEGQWRAIQGEGAKKQRIELRALGGGGQGGWTEFGAPQKMEMDEVHKHLRMHLDGLGDKIDGQVRKEIELKMRGAHGQGPRSVTLFGEEGGPGHEGHVVIIGPDGERREWRTGGTGKMRVGGEGGVQIFEFRDGDGADGHLFKQPGAKGQKAEPKRIQLRPARPMNVI